MTSIVFSGVNTSRIDFPSGILKSLQYQSVPMGSSSSKAAKAAAGATTRRQYPNRPPPTSNPTADPRAAESQAAAEGPSVYPPPYASTEKDLSQSLLPSY